MSEKDKQELLKLIDTYNDYLDVYQKQIISFPTGIIFFDDNHSTILKKHVSDIKKLVFEIEFIKKYIIKIP